MIFKKKQSARILKMCSSIVKTFFEKNIKDYRNKKKTSSTKWNDFWQESSKNLHKHLWN